MGRAATLSARLCAGAAAAAIASSAAAQEAPTTGDAPPPAILPRLKLLLTPLSMINEFQIPGYAISRRLALSICLVTS